MTLMHFVVLVGLDDYIVRFNLSEMRRIQPQSFKAFHFLRQRSCVLACLLITCIHFSCLCVRNERM